MTSELSRDALKARIAELENQLEGVKLELAKYDTSATHQGNTREDPGSLIRGSDTSVFSKTPSRHYLLLLADSAFPLGSFAYSNGLESFLAHHKLLSSDTNQVALLHRYLRLSIQSVAYTNLPYVLAGFRTPALLSELDNDLDASTPCKVARAASVAQGRALLSIWEKSLRAHALCLSPYSEQAFRSLEIFSHEVKLALQSNSTFGANGHLAPLWGVVSVALSQDIHDVAYLFLFNHAKATVSAAVRANVLGPYSAQSVLAGQALQQLIRACVERIWDHQPEDAGQVVPTMDLWLGRHELLYSRIFNS